MVLFRFIFVCWCLMVFTKPAMSAEPILVDLAQDTVDITTGFNGADIVVYGIKNPDETVAVTVEGPLKNMTVRQKSKAWGIWMNNKKHTFLSVPGYYNYAVFGEPEQAFAPLTYVFKGKNNDAGNESKDIFKKALLRNKIRQGLFFDQPGDIALISSTFFKTQFHLPSNVPTGLYTVRTYDTTNGTSEPVHETRLNVSQIGVSAWVNQFSKTYALIYGILCVVFAIVAGWLSSAIKNKLR